jgi:hypothetical protein
VLKTTELFKQACSVSAVYGKQISSASVGFLVFDSILAIGHCLQQGFLPECKEDSGRYQVNFLGSRSTRVGIGYF